MSISTTRREPLVGDTVAAHQDTTSIGNSLLALAAIGSGLVLVGTGAGSAPVGAVPLLVLGVASFVWAVVVLRRDRVPFLRTSFAAAVGTIIVWVVIDALASLGATTAPPLGPMASSTIMLLAVAGVLAARLRRETLGAEHTEATTVPRRPRTPRQPSTARYLLTLLAGAVVVAALTAPALAQTHAGEFAVPHGSLHSGH
ncbi:hypothetical protein KXS11_10270 [Plantibacter flavus]|uniref:hypothetical protein n=1 Tax=Plantibacter flavus TaxID=150123 RepID=UPI003F16B1AE